MAEMTKFQEFFFHHSDKDVPPADEARKQFQEEFARLVDKKVEVLRPKMEAGLTPNEVASELRDDPSRPLGDVIGFYKLGGELFGALELSGELDKSHRGYKHFQQFLHEMRIQMLAKVLGIEL